MMATNKMEPRQHCQIRIDDDQCIEPLAKVVSHVHDHGSKVVAQLVVMGSAILLPEVPEGEHRIIFSPSGVTEKVAKWTQESQALTVSQIHELTSAVALAAERAQKAGFDASSSTEPTAIWPANSYRLTLIPVPMNTAAA